MRVPLPSPYSDATYMEQGYFINNGIVENIRIYNFNLAPNYYLPKFLETYGQPSEVWIQTFSQEEISQWNFTYYLFYKDKGILVEYGLATPIEDAVIDGKLQNCLKVCRFTIYISMVTRTKQTVFSRCQTKISLFTKSV